MAISRSFSALLSRLGQHHSYLESMASRLSHELRTPIAVVRSSLENLHLESMPESAQTYIGRAEAGLGRLTRILARMSEASRMEQSLATTDPERFDLRGVVSECVHGYRIGSPRPRFHRQPAASSGVGERCARSGCAVARQARGQCGRLRPPGYTDLRRSGFRWADRCGAGGVQSGPQLPAELEGRLFESMVSGRKGRRRPAHLGLGLYVARMIARFHGGELSAENLRDGVRFSATFSLA